jgi:hypothetical protein
MSSINKFDDHDVNRGAELMLRRRKKNSIPEQLQERKFNFGRVFSFLQREIKFNIELSIISKM